MFSWVVIFDYKVQEKKKPSFCLKPYFLFKDIPVIFSTLFIAHQYSKVIVLGDASLFM